jgi:hypothetical protein
VCGDIAISEAIKASAKAIGKSVYTGCILTPPITPPQVTACTALYNSYIAKLAKVAAPGILTPSNDIFHYPSPYDVCSYDASHFVFDLPTSQPYCPTTPL